MVEDLAEPARRQKCAQAGCSRRRCALECEEMVCFAAGAVDPSSLIWMFSLSAKLPDEDVVSEDGSVVNAQVLMGCGIETVEEPGLVRSLLEKACVAVRAAYG